MHEIFEKLCKENNVTPYKVGKETGIATSTFSDWKIGRSNPKQDKLKKVADYFGVSLDYLMTGKEPEFDNLSDEMATMLAKIQKDTELAKALQKYFAMSDEQKKCILDTINLMIRE